MERVKRFFKTVSRVKTITGDIQQTELKRCLNTFELTLLGIGHMVGAGIYVLTGTVVREKAGPSAVLSYLFAGFAALLSALCYAEFGAQMPKAGSAYCYTYVTAGEIWGFLVGWNMILESMIGVASVARAWSGTMDALFDGAIRNGTVMYVGHLVEGSRWISDYPDLLAAAIILVIFSIVATGAKPSVIFNAMFTLINAIVIVFIMGCGFSHANLAYWTSDRYGGFFPFGFSGTLSAAATCFFAYIGFEGIAVASEEARTPAKSVPLATLVAMIVVSVMYMGVTSALTLMVPYYDVSLSAAFPDAFKDVGEKWAEYLVAVGTLLGISCSLLGGAYSLPRTVYALSDDGLLFGFLSYIQPVTQTPIFSVLIFGLLSALMAILFDIETLVEFMSIGTLFAYTFVAANLVILRYLPKARYPFKPRTSDRESYFELDTADGPCSSAMKSQEDHASWEEVHNEKCPTTLNSTEDKYPDMKSHLYPKLQDPEHMSRPSSSENTPILNDVKDFGVLRARFRGLPVLSRLSPGKGVELGVACLVMVLIAFSALLVFCFHFFIELVWWSFLLLFVLVACIVFFFFVIVVHEQNHTVVTFQVPLVPFLPLLSVWLNIMLMMSMSYITWLRLVVWIVVGLLVYITYGIRHSKEKLISP